MNNLNNRMNDNKHDNLLIQYREYVTKNICNTPIVTYVKKEKNNSNETNNNNEEYEEIKIYNKSIHKLNKENIDFITDYIHQIFSIEQNIVKKNNITNVRDTNIKFIAQLKQQYRELFNDILINREQIRKYDIYNGIKELIIDTNFKYKNSFKDICLIWMFDYDMTRSVPNYNLLFLNIYSKFFKNRTYLTNFTPETLLTGHPTEFVDITSDPEIYQLLLRTNHNYIYIDDISYSGNQLTDDIEKWKTYIIDNFKDELERSITYVYRLKIYLYGITSCAYLKFIQMMNSYRTNVDKGVTRYLNKKIFIELNFSRILYTSIPYIFEKYIEYKIKQESFTNCKINQDYKIFEIYNEHRLTYLKFDENSSYDTKFNFKDLNIKINNTLHILENLKPNDIILFGDFYFTDEINEFCHMVSTRLQTFYHIDYKIPDNRSINNRLFFGYVPIFLLDTDNLAQDTKHVGVIQDTNTFVYKLQLYDDYMSLNTQNISNDNVFKRINLENVKSIYSSNEKELKLYKKPYIPWYKKYIKPS